MRIYSCNSQASAGDLEAIDGVLDEMEKDDLPPEGPNTPPRPRRHRSRSPPSSPRPSRSPISPEQPTDVSPTSQTYNIFKKILNPQNQLQGLPFKTRITVKMSPSKSRVFEEAELGILSKAKAFSGVNPAHGGQHKTVRAAMAKEEGGEDDGADEAEKSDDRTRSAPMKAMKEAKAGRMKRPAGANEAQQESGTPSAKAKKVGGTPPKEDRPLPLYIFHCIFFCVSSYLVL